ncbi:MAG: endonuclease/exonuclease/phosphatase family protein [Myxococcales bacterium]|nr:endonuclease/exonuclease/phosphatase family protein [Myxococcales bacterium]
MRLLALSLWGLLACGRAAGPAPDHDGGAPGPADAAVADAGDGDAGPVDGGTADASSSADAGVDGGVTVVTFNLLHGLLDEDPAASPYDRFPERLPRIAQTLAQLRPDVILLQEVNQSTLLGYPDVLGTMLGELNRGGGQPYTAVFGGILGGAPTVNSGSGLGQATITLLPVLSKANHSVVQVQALSPRSVLHVRVSTGLGPLDLFNAHLQGPSDATKANQEMSDVLAFVNTQSAPGGLALLGGDLNSPESAPVYQLLRSAGFVDLGAAAGLVCSANDNRGCTNETFPLAQAGNRTSQKLDYLWVRGTAASSCASIFEQPFQLPGGVLWASDHIGVSARVWR